jgi:hypothetical protein
VRSTLVRSTLVRSTLVRLRRYSIPQECWLPPNSYKQRLR